ncbi:DsbA family protein [Leucobacter sp. GX24907]
MADGARRSPSVAVGVPLTIFGIIAFVIVGSFLLQRGWEPKEEQPTAQEQAAWQAQRASGEDPLVLGESNATLELVVYSDFQCPFCNHWNRETLPALIDYVDTGELRIVWRDVSAPDEASERGARAAYAAGLQGRFLDYHNALMENPQGAPDDELTEEALIALAEKLDLEIDRFTIDMTSPEVEQAIVENEREGRSRGVTQTPSFRFNDELISGYQPTDAFIENIETALQQGG